MIAFRCFRICYFSSCRRVSLSSTNSPQATLRDNALTHLLVQEDVPDSACCLEFEAPGEESDDPLEQKESWVNTVLLEVTVKFLVFESKCVLKVGLQLSNLIHLESEVHKEGTVGDDGREDCECPE